MDKFIWIGKHAVNLDCIVRFTVEDDGSRVTVLLRDVPTDDERITVDGTAATRLMGALKEIQLGAEAESIEPAEVLLFPSREPSEEESGESTIGKDR
jgi:hypothetical protein